MVIVLQATGLNDEHRVGQVDVHATAEAARAAASKAGEETPGISFLKEQQWSLDFGTALVREQSVRESIRVPARLEARPGGAADVAAPIDGRLTRVLDVALGTSVSPRARARAAAASARRPRRSAAAAAGAGGRANRARSRDARSRACRAVDQRRGRAGKATRRSAFRRGAGEGAGHRGRGEPRAIQRGPNGRRRRTRTGCSSSGHPSTASSPSATPPPARTWRPARSCSAW